MASTRTLRFDDGAVQFRQRLVAAILASRPILIRNIRADDLEAPGLREYEASFLRLLTHVTNGSRMEINNTGTQLRFVPGVLLGGEIEHVCPVGEEARSIGWFLEGILPLAPFGKEPLRLRFTGITDGTCEVDPSPDYFRAVIFPLLEQFGVGVEDKDDFMAGSGPSLRITKRGAAPQGGGSVDLYCPIVRELKAMDYTDPGLIKRVRGTAVSCKLVSSSSAARVAYTAKGLLHRLLPDVWIHTDAHTVKQHGCGPSPGLSVILQAESTTGVRLAAECGLDYRPSSKELPEDLGTRSAAALLEEIRRGGCIDTGLQSLAFLWMCLGPEDVSRIRVGTLSEYAIESLRLFKLVFGVEFKVTPDHESKTVVLSCLGTGYRNMARAST